MCFFFERHGKDCILSFVSSLHFITKVSQISQLLAHNFGRNITEFTVSFTSASKKVGNIKTTEELLVMVFIGISFHLIKVHKTDLELCFFVFSSAQAYSNYEVFSLRGSIIDMHYLQ